MMRNGWTALAKYNGHEHRRSRFWSLAMIRLVGYGPFLLVHLPIMVLAASIGVWLFYVQHQFEDTSLVP